LSIWAITVDYTEHILAAYRIVCVNGRLILGPYPVLSHPLYEVIACLMALALAMPCVVCGERRIDTSLLFTVATAPEVMVK